MRRKLGLQIFILFLFSFYLTACGPTTFKRTMYDYKPYNKNKTEQSKSGITIKNHDFNQLPPTFTRKVQKCDLKTGKLLVDSGDEPILERVSILPKNSLIYKVSITNNLDHIVRLNKSIITLFDPANNRYDLATKDSICSTKQSQRPCPNTSQLCNQLSSVKMFTKNTELLPKRTETGFLIFLTKDNQIPGIWKLSFYDIPINLNEAGEIEKKVSFNFRTECLKYRVKYRKDSAFAKPKIIDKKELNQ